jgi:TonB family protein
MTAATMDEREIQRRFRRNDLDREEQQFLRLLSTLGLVAFSLIVYAHEFPPPAKEVPREEPVRIASLRIEPPPPEEKKEEPKPEPLPPRQAAEKPKQAPEKVAQPPPPAARQEPPAAPAKRSVASMGLLSMLSSSEPRESAASQRIAPPLENVNFREVREDLSEDLGSLTGTAGARERASVGEMVAGLPRGSGTKVVLEGRVVTPISGPDAPTISGEGGGRSGRTITEIRQVVATYVAGLKYLYDRELKRRPGLHGKVTVEFVVDPGGSVSGVRLVRSALDHGELERAILSRIQGWKFPGKPGDSTKVTFPFDFVAPAG